MDGRRETGGARGVGTLRAWYFRQRVIGRGRHREPPPERCHDRGCTQVGGYASHFARTDLAGREAAANASPSDGELLARARGRDPAALAAIYDRYRPGLRRYAARLLSSTPLADECVAEAFSRFIDAIEGAAAPTNTSRPTSTAPRTTG